MNAALADTQDSSELSDTEFAAVARIAKRHAGLDLQISKRSMISSRLNKRICSTNHAGFASYLSDLESTANPDEIKALVSVLTTNVSHFFREAHHFTTFGEQVLPELLERAREGQPVRIWSAGCSTGQEPYTIAMSALAESAELARLDFRILATDIDEAVLATAKRGHYSERQLDGIPGQLRRQFLSKTISSEPNTYAISAAVRDLVTFRPLNLVGPWPLRKQFDVIFCRNVVIYFDLETQNQLWPRFAQTLRPGGWLFLGHSERVGDGIAPDLVNAGVTTYRRSDARCRSTKES